MQNYHNMGQSFYISSSFSTRFKLVLSRWHRHWDTSPERSLDVSVSALFFGAPQSPFAHVAPEEFPPQTGIVFVQLYTSLTLAFLTFTNGQRRDQLSTGFQVIIFSGAINFTTMILNFVSFCHCAVLGFGRDKCFCSCQ